ncbi:MAG: PAS domain S-box protein [Ignavibacteriae bacterium]|nr:PAS domain S-box protein [Ignavibacteriota bacterium]MCB9242172.1 PAS domain S-box protein [Ignavibacteriales bacterium]
MKEIFYKIGNTLNKLSGPGVFFTALLLSLIIGSADLITGKKLLISFFYFIPVVISSIYGGRRTGILIGLVSGIIYFVTGVFANSWSTPVDSILNLILPAIIFMTAAAFISTRREEKPASSNEQIPARLSSNGMGSNGTNGHGERDFRKFFDNAIDAIYATDEQGNLVVANSAFFDITGYSEKEISSLNYKNLVSPSHRKKVDTFYKRQFINRTQNSYIEFPILTKKGDEKWVAQNTYMIQENGSVSEFYFVTRDISEQVKSKKFAEDNEKKLRQIIDLVPHFIFAKDINGKFILANQATAEVYGTTVEDLLTKTDADFAKSKEEAEGFRKDDLEVIKSGEAKFIQEEKITDAEGNVRYLQTIKIPYTEPETNKAAVLGVSTDITERKSFLEALLESETKFRSFAKTAPVALTRYDPQVQRYEFVNDEFIRQSGYAKEEFDMLSEEQLQDMLHEEDREKIYKSFKKWQEKGYKGIEHLDYRITNKTGSIVWLDTYFYADRGEDGNLKYINQICVDITEQKLIEQSLKRSEERYKTFIHHSTEGIYRLEMENPVDISLDEEEFVKGVFDNAYIAECNDAMARMYGFENTEDALNKKLIELHGSGDVTENTNTFLSFIRSGLKISNAETIEMDKDGNKKYFNNNAVGMVENGMLMRIWGSQSDITERKEIIEQNRKLYRAVEQSSASIIITNTSGVIEYVNHKFSEITGYPAEEVLGKVARIFKKGTIVGLENNRELIDIIAGGVEWSGEYLNRRKNDENYWEYANISPIKNDNGEVTHFVAICEDITDQKLTEDSIRRSEERYRAFITHSSEGIYRMELRKPININSSLEEHINHFMDHAYLAECNDVMAKMYGYEKAEEVVNKQVKDLLGNREESQASNSISFESFVKAGYRINNSETKEIDKEGNVKYFLNNGVGIIENDHLVRLWGTQRDITQLRMMQEELRKLSRAVEQSPDSVIITNTEGKIVYVNPKFSEVTGFTPAEVHGMYPFILLKGEAPKEIYNEIWDAMREGNDWKGEYFNRKKNGERYWEYATISPIKDEEGNITHYVYVKEDISERKVFENELLSAKEKAEEASNAKSRFLANMSHEIRTPMNGIVGMAQLLTLTDLNEEQSEYVDMIHYSSDVLLKIINDVLDFSKIESGKFKLNEEEFNIIELLDNTFKILRSDAESKRLKFVFDVDKALNIKVLGDRYRLNQILTNLISNAIKFTQQGEIRVKVKEAARKGSKIMLEFIISDTGIGIPSDKFESLFESFTQLENPYVKQYMGTGLGLSIVKRLIDMMKGEISVTSEEDKGSEFTVRLDFKLVK